MVSKRYHVSLTVSVLLTTKPIRTRIASAMGVNFWHFYPPKEGGSKNGQKSPKMAKNAIFAFSLGGHVSPRFLCGFHARKNDVFQKPGEAKNPPFLGVLDPFLGVRIASRRFFSGVKSKQKFEGKWHPKTDKFIGIRVSVKPPKGFHRQRIRWRHCLLLNFASYCKVESPIPKHTQRCMHWNWRFLQ